MQEIAVSIDCSISLAEAGRDAVLQHIIDSDLPEQVVTRTLRSAPIDPTARPPQSYSLSLLITGDEEIQSLNRQYRHQDKPTDVLSFPLLDHPIVAAPEDQLWTTSQEDEQGDTENDVSEQLPGHPDFISPPELATSLGDIVISWPTVARQAEQAGHSPAYELLYLLSHGVLHLAGYDDQTEAGYAAMVGIQEKVMREVAQHIPTG
jgi:probable rRNA maturation factor